jgi:hypothetical protein
MKILRCIRYLPLIFMLLAAVMLVCVWMSGESDYSDSTFVFSRE